MDATAISGTASVPPRRARRGRRRSRARPRGARLFSGCGRTRRSARPRPATSPRPRARRRHRAGDGLRRQAGLHPRLPQGPAVRHRIHAAEHRPLRRDGDRARPTQRGRRYERIKPPRDRRRRRRTPSPATCSRSGTSASTRDDSATSSSAGGSSAGEQGGGLGGPAAAALPLPVDVHADGAVVLPFAVTLRCEGRPPATPYGASRASARARSTRASRPPRACRPRRRAARARRAAPTSHSASTGGRLSRMIFGCPLSPTDSLSPHSSSCSFSPGRDADELDRTSSARHSSPGAAAPCPRGGSCCTRDRESLRVAHVEHEDLAAAADRTGLHDERHGLRDRHEVPRHLRGGRPSPGRPSRSAAEGRNDAAGRVEDVAEADRDEARLDVPPVPERLDDPLAERLRLAHHRLRVDGLVGRDRGRSARPPNSAARSATIFVATTLLRTDSSGCVSISGTCLYAAPWKTIVACSFSKLRAVTPCGSSRR